MEQILRVIELALRAKGISASAASELATQNKSTIKNFQAMVEKDGERKRKTTIDNLISIAEILDLEFYFGPKRPPAVETRLVIRSIEDEAPVIPMHEAFGRFAPRYLAVSRDWLAMIGLDPDCARLIQVQTDMMEPTLHHDDLAIIDTSKTVPQEGAGEVYAVRLPDSGPSIRRLTVVGGHWLLTADSPVYPSYSRTVSTAHDRLSHAPLGKVVAVLTQVGGLSQRKPVR